MDPAAIHPLAAGAVVAMVAAGAVLALAAVLIWRRRLLSPAEKEHRRRLRVSREGRLGDCVILESRAGVLYYSYSVHGVQYDTSQDVSAVLDRPAKDDPEALVGPATLKFLPRNPANSVVWSEEWCGLRFRQRAEG